MPYLGAHNSIGTDYVTLIVSSGDMVNQVKMAIKDSVFEPVKERAEFMELSNMI